MKTAHKCRVCITHLKLVINLGETPAVIRNSLYQYAQTHIHTHTYTIRVLTTTRPTDHTYHTHTHTPQSSSTFSSASLSNNCQFSIQMTMCRSCPGYSCPWCGFHNTRVVPQFLISSAVVIWQCTTNIKGGTWRPENLSIMYEPYDDNEQYFLERDRVAGWVSFGQKWKMIICRQVKSIVNHCDINRPTKLSDSLK